MKNLYGNLIKENQHLRDLLIKKELLEPIKMTLCSKCNKELIVDIKESDKINKENKNLKEALYNISKEAGEEED